MKIQRESPKFAPWDAQGMAAHLEDMESQGWQFRGTDWLGRWEYIPAEPKSVRYAIACAPSRRNWRLAPTEAERNLEDLCFEAGWCKLAALSRFHIYRNGDPDATPLETDEEFRLRTLDRSLGRAAMVSSLACLAGGAGILATLIWALLNEPPRALAVPMLPFCFVFALWLMVSQTLSWLLYQRWLRAARTAARSGLPCPAVTGWQQFARFRQATSILLFGWILAGGKIALVLIYVLLFGCFYGLRWLLEHRMHNELLAENLFQVSLIVLLILLFAVNRWYSPGMDQGPEVDAIPLMVQDFVDADGMELRQFDMNGSESLLASYHDYWQTDSAGSFHLSYTVSDLYFTPLDGLFRNHFLDRFQSIAARDGLTVSAADPALWGVEEVLCARTDGEDQWLIFFDARTVHLFASWNMTKDEIAIAAEKLAP